MRLVTSASAGTVVTPLVLRHLGGRRYRVEQDCTYITRAGRRITVDAGFVTDGGSVPRILWPLYPPFGSDNDEAYVVHDFLYAHAEDFTGDENGGHISREECDAVMLEIMEVKGFRRTGRLAVWSGVRLGGWWPWRAHRTRASQESD